MPAGINVAVMTIERWKGNISGQNALYEVVIISQGLDRVTCTIFCSVTALSP